MKYLIQIIALASLSSALFAQTVTNPPFDNFGVIYPGELYRGERIDEQEDKFDYLQSLGVTHIINMETLHHDDPELCHQKKINCEEFPIFLPPVWWGDLLFNYDTLEKAFHYINELLAKHQIVYIHCFHGSDRTGALAAAFTIRKYVCNNSNYDRQLLLKQIDDDLTKYKFHDSLYSRLKQKVESWTTDTPAWICQ